MEDLGFVEKSKASKKNSTLSEIFKLFKENENFRHFPAFAQIDVKQYSSLQELATEIRNIFNDYFIQSVGDPVSYNLTFNFCNFFEELYSKFESKSFIKESKHIMELKKKINKLRREIKENVQPINNKLKITLCENTVSKKIKYSLFNNIKALNSEQMKGLMNILHDYINVESERIFEFDIDKVSPHKIKELSKYVNHCLKQKKTSFNYKEDSVKDEEVVRTTGKPVLAMLSDSDSLSSDDESDV